MKYLISVIVCVTLLSCSKPVAPPTPYGACPTAAQVEWQKMETNMFIHFGPNTFTGVEWGSGKESESVFNPVDNEGNPTSANVEQWVGVALDCGFKGIILTAKHHDGFYLCHYPFGYPARPHTICDSPYRGGNGDIVRELGNLCEYTGVKFGVYVSPWDRYDPLYGTGEPYNKEFAKFIEELHSRFNIFEQWFDGAKGKGEKPQEYDFELFNKSVLDKNPNAIIFSDVGPGCRWVGNEQGYARQTNWSTYSPQKHNAAPGNTPGDYEQYLGSGDEGGDNWIPAETDVSIRTEKGGTAPRWFWNREGQQTRSAENLLRLYYQSVGRNSLLLLNVPPTTNGSFAEEDVTSLRRFKELKDSVFNHNFADNAIISATNCRGKGYEPKNIIDGNFDTYFATEDNRKAVDIDVVLEKEVTFNRLLLGEYIPLGQRVRSFKIYYKNGEQWKELKDSEGNELTTTTIGYKRILLTESVTTDQVQVSITDALACPTINQFGLYYDPFGEEE